MSSYNNQVKYLRKVLKDMTPGIVKKVKILGSADSCPECMKNIGKILTLDEAKKNGPLPVASCTHKYGCRCDYIPVWD